MPKQEEDIEELVRRRQLEEQKIMEATKQRRKLKQRQLIGADTEGVGDRKHHIDDAKKLWSVKGTTEEDKKAQLQSYGATTIEASALDRAKQQYEQNLQSNKDKGKSIDHLEAAEDEVPVLDDLKQKYNKPKSKVPPFFAKKKEPQTTTTVESLTDKTAGMAIGFGDEFETIESEEVTMVGLEKHIKVTGISKAGRRVTRTKIVLPKVVGETKLQSQKATNGNGNENNPLMPQNFDGTYYSLEDIKHRNIPDYDRVIDKNNREQYLSPAEFESVFGMTKEEFAKLPKWKRVNKKRGLHLY